MSFFSSKPKNAAPKSAVQHDDYERATTGTEVDSVVANLIHHCADREESVRLAVKRSLQQIATHRTELVVTSIMAFVAKKSAEKKLSHVHRVQCLNILAGIMSTSRDEISPSVGESLAKFASTEMVASREVKQDWQGPASEVLSSLSMVYPDVVIDRILSLFRAGTLPHYYVIVTLGEIASASGVAFALRLGDVLERAIPVLGGINKEPMKWAFAAALGRFAQSVEHFHANASEEERARFSDESFQSNMASAFDVIFNNWLVSREPKVRLAVAESLGHICDRLSESALDARLRKLITAYMLLYKKERFPEHLAISLGLSAAIEAAVERDITSLEFAFPEVMAGLHPFVCVAPDPSKPKTFKNHNEILRCFEIMARWRLDAVLTFITNRFQQREAKSLVGALLILRHLVNAMDEELAEQKTFVLSSVAALVTENSLHVRKVLLQLVVGMANQGYLSLPGGHVLVRFLAKQCAISDEQIAAFDAKNKKSDGDAVSPAQLRSASNHILHVMTTKVTSTHGVLWPYLLELISAPDFTPAVVVLCRCISDLVEIKVEAGESVQIDFDVNPNLPPPQTILARLMVLANVPFRKRGMGTAVVDCMGALGGMLHPAVGEYWDEAVPALRDYLDEHSEEDLNKAKWQDTLLKVFRETVAAIGPGPWLRKLAQSLSEQYDLYKGDSVLLRVVSRYLGQLLSLTTARELVSSRIDLIMDKCNHASDLERQGCGQGLGLVATRHLDVVLPKITERLTKLTKEKKRSFFSFGSSSDKPESEPEKSTMALCYGYTVAYADANLIASRLEAHVIHNLVPLMDSAKTVVLKENLIKAIDLIAKAMSPERLPPSSKFVLKARDRLVLGILQFMGYVDASAAGKKKRKSAKAKNKKQLHDERQLRLLGINAVATLANLAPALSSKGVTAILDTVLPFFAGDGDDAGAAEDDEEDEDGVGLLMKSVQNLLSNIVVNSCTLPSLKQLMQRLEYYVVSENERERLLASAAYLVVLKKFVHQVNTEQVLSHPQEFRHVGMHLATLLPRVTDPDQRIRKTAVENVQALLYAAQLAANPHNPAPSQEVRLLSEIRDAVNVADSELFEHEEGHEPEDGEERPPDTMLRVLADLASVLAELLQPEDFMDMLTRLLSGLNDAQKTSREGAGVLLDNVLQKRVAELRPNVNDLVQGLLKNLPDDEASYCHEAVLACLRTLASTHFDETYGALLDSEHPVSSQVKAGFCALAGKQDALAKKTIDALLRSLNDTPVEDGKSNPKMLVATVAMGEIVQLASMKPVFESVDTDIYSSVLAALLLRFGTASASGKSTGIDEAQDALRSFVEHGAVQWHFGAVCTGELPIKGFARKALPGDEPAEAATEESESAAEDAEPKAKEGEEAQEEFNAWDGALTGDSVASGCADVLRALCLRLGDAQATFKSNMIRVLTEFLSQRRHHSHRTVATACLGEFLLHSADEEHVIEELIRLLLPQVADQEEKVRFQALKALGNLSLVWCVACESCSESILSVLTSATEDACAKVAAQAVESLTLVCRVANESTIKPASLSILYRLRSAFDRSEAEIRRAAFRLFEALVSYGSKQRGFLDQVHALVPTFVVHLYDDDDEVSTACLGAFRALSEVIQPELHTCLTEKADFMYSSQDFDKLVEAVAPILTAAFPEHLGTYLDGAVANFKSTWPVITGNAAIFSANLLASATPELRRRINVAANIRDLTALLKESSGQVRARAAKALSLLYEL